MKICVIVPVRNEESSITHLLEALLAQSLPPDEIVITDGGSTDATTAIIQRYVDRGASVRLIRTTHALPGRGRNLGVQHSTSDWLAFTDAGIEPEKNWLASLAAKAASDPTIDVVYGSYEPRTDSFFKECAAICYVSPPTQVEGAPMRGRFIASILMRRGVWETVGGFPEHLRSAEDLLFMNKIDEAHFRIGYATAAIVRWDLQPTFWRTFKRFAVYSRNNIRAGFWRQWQRPILSRYLVLVLLLLPGFIFSRWWLIVPVALWLLLLLARAAVAIWRNRICFPAGVIRNLRRLVVLLPLIALLDLGALVGSVQWVVRDKLAGHGNG